MTQRTFICKLKVRLDQAKESMPWWKWSEFQILMAEVEMQGTREQAPAIEVRMYKVPQNWHPGICPSYRWFNCTQWTTLDGFLKYKTNFVKVS